MTGAAANSNGAKRVAFVSAEVAPFVKVGGLADVAGSLPGALRAAGADVAVILPRYGSIDPARHGLEPTGRSVDIDVAGRTERFAILRATLAGDVPVYLLDNPRLFGAPDVYIEPLDRERFFAFSSAALEMIPAIGFAANVLHCNDWHSAMAVVWQRERRRRRPAGSRPASVLTIHNLAHQGITDVDYARQLGYEPGELLDVEIARYPNTINVLARAIRDADVITTVSPRYALEIQTEQSGAGLEPLLRQRADDLRGILNGIDVTVFDPATDQRIACTFSLGDLSGKGACKRRLQEIAGLDLDPAAPLIGVVSRLDEQKGFDLIAAALERILGLGFQFVLLGTGDPRYEAAFRDLQGRFAGRAASFLTFDPTLAQAIYAGSDFFLMPSRFEPCGLGQMIAMRYGTSPIVRATGGLADTVFEWNPTEGTGTGFLFAEYRPEAMVAAIERGLVAYRSPHEWTRLIENDLRFDASWARSAQDYLAAYDDALRRTMDEGERAP